MEKFLENLSRRSCRYHILFLEDHAHSCVPFGGHRHAHKYLLARSIIVKILELFCQGDQASVELHRFTSLRDQSLKSYLEDSAIYFICCNDGAAPLVALETELDEESHEKRRLQEQSKLFLRSTICWFLGRGHDVVLINGMQFQDMKVMAFVLRGDRHGIFSDKYLETLIATSGDQIRARVDDQNTLALNTGWDVLRVSNVLRVLQEALDLRPIPCNLLLAATAIRFLDHVPELRMFGATLVIHVLLLNMTTLPDRRVEDVVFDADGERRYSAFVERYSQFCDHVIRRPELNSLGDVSLESLVDLIDGRYMRAVISAAMEGKLKASNLPTQVQEQFKQIQGALTELQELGELQCIPLSRSDPARNMQDLKLQPSSVLPFNHPVLDNHLSSIQLVIREDQRTKGTKSKRVFDEVTHWHNSRKKLNSGRHIAKTAMTPKEEMRFQRSIQRFHAEMTRYAESLTNSDGIGLTPENIIVNKGGKTVSREKRSNQPQTPSSLAKSSRLKQVAATPSSHVIPDAWIRKRTDLDKLMDVESRYIQIVSYQKQARAERKGPAVSLEMKAYELAVLVQIWTGYCRRQQKSRGFHVAALIFTCLQQLAEMEVPCPSDLYTKLEDVARLMFSMDLPLKLMKITQKLSFSFLQPTDFPLSVDMGVREFCLKYVGPYMKRALDSSQDSRVSFEPDKWQRDVLDELDDGHSLFLVAPTSSGKTFISFYAMEKVLRAGDDGVVVYVAPTKALVNQVAAECQARFKKRYAYAGTSLYAIHTRDYRVNDPVKCQILVTVPHILQIMLLSAVHAKSWVPRIKTIIFDEVHCIGQSEDGVVWEQLLLMAPSQVIALSATVGNPHAFSEWLSDAQSSVGVPLKTIEHHVRFSDLRKFFYQPPGNFLFTGLPEKPPLAPLGLDGVPDFDYMHPITCLTNRKRGLPDDLALESADCLSLYTALVTCETDAFKVPPNLSPENALPRDNIIKADVLAWSEKLKAFLLMWMKAVESPFQRVVKMLEKSAVEPEVDSTKTTPDAFYGSAIPLLCRLHESDALPAIFFNYDRSVCERLASTVLDHLESAEKSFKEVSAKWKAKVTRFEAWKTAQVSRKAPKVVKKKGKGKGQDENESPASKLDRSMEDGMTEESQFQGFDPDAPLRDFSFADMKKADADELAKTYGQLRWRGVNERLLSAFSRGIGVHHAGMNRRYRQAVEMWFRKGFLRVVIATGTLSLGINMPCKTVVFYGDSVFLTALNFRQAAGRAGRRGFDLLGNVVFHMLPRSKAYRLLSSRLPDLNGHFPLTTTLVLRLLSLLHTSGNAPNAVQAVNSLLSQPRLYLGGEKFKIQVLHHLRFSIEYLRSQDLIGPKGEPINFTPCVSHLYFAENGAFAFHALLRGGYFHSLARQYLINPKEALRILMIVMANIFSRRPFPQVEKENEKELIKRSSSVVMLPSLPSEAYKVLRRHNEEILSIYTTYVQTFAEQHCEEQTSQLPFTRSCVGPTRCVSDFKLPGSLSRTQSRSCFVAVSGHGDSFTSVTDLCSNVRDGIFLEKAVVPHLDLGDELNVPLNAYLYDFYQHGSVKPLEEANRIRRGDVWAVLNDFSMILATLVASFEGFLGLNTAEIDMASIGGLAERTEVEIDEKDAENETSSSTTMASGSTPNSSSNQASNSGAFTVKTKKAKVADDWEAALDEEMEKEEEDARRAVQMEDLSEEDEDWIESSKENVKLTQVYRMLYALKEEFDMKFRPIFA